MTPEERREYNHEWHIKNQDAILKRHREYHKANREHELARMREWYKQNREKKREYQAKHPGTRGAYSSAQDYHREKTRKWIKAHPGCYRKWRETNPSRLKAKDHKRRALIKGNGGSFTANELKALFEQQEGFCFYCGELLYSSFDKDVHVEHKIPISRGGSNNIDNIVLACAPCNYSKGMKTHEEFMTVTRSNNCDNKKGAAWNK